MSTALSVPRSRLTRSGLAAFALALGLNGAWWYLLAHTRTSGLAPAPIAPSPHLVYTPESASMAESRALGSPVLFALPNDLGFSGREGRGVDRAPAGLRSSVGTPVLLARPPVSAPSPSFLQSLDQTVVASAPTEPVVSLAAHAFATPTGVTGFVLRVYWPDGAPAVRGGLPGAGVLAAVLQDRPWELGAVLEFDDQGNVRHVFIDKPTPSRERNEAVARALRAVRIDGGGQESRARVVVQYDQDAGPRAPAGGAGRP